MTYLARSMALTALMVSGLAAQRPVGDSRVVGAVPFPGYPEGIVVSKGKIYVSGPAVFGVPENEAQSVIHVYDLDTGAYERNIPIQNQPANAPRAQSCIAADNQGNLYVIDVVLGVLKIDPKKGTQSIYAAGFVPVYQSVYQAGPAVLPNDLAFDKKGNLYVTDSFQATIWRIPPGGGAPQVWFQDPRLDGIFGPNGIRFDKKGDTMYFSVTVNGLGEGYIYKLPVKEQPVAADLELFHTYAGAGPDGIAFGKSGKLYVALALSNQISVLREDGTEETRYSGPAGALPWANPANIAFNDKAGTLLVTNHASLTGLPDPSPLFAIFDVVVNDKAGKMFE